ncbi:hypothetical protein AAFN85_25940 [Mucilaginibacter sp. CAU 1740]|uniref:hypothetical protein n=1 Tax=Mucilaginibacter sp. CAU 1740 TaxID=3140365 RepID=UPI00325B519B
MEFGRFKIMEESGRTSTYVEYRCVDKHSSQNYWLKLPHNATSLANKDIVFPEIIRLWNTYSNKDTPRTRQYYGVINNHYLDCVSDPLLNEGAWPVIKILKTFQANDLPLFGLWEGVALQMLTEASWVCDGELSEEKFIGDWKNLVGGSILREAVISYMDNGDMSRTEKLRVAEKISQKYIDYPELAENILLRLIGGMSRGRIEPEDAIATLLCPQFRCNITDMDILQISDCKKALSRQIGPEVDMLWLTFVLEMMKVFPDGKPEQLKRISNKGITNNYSLYLETH